MDWTQQQDLPLFKLQKLSTPVPTQASVFETIGTNECERIIAGMAKKDSCAEDANSVIRHS